MPLVDQLRIAERALYSVQNIFVRQQILMASRRKILPYMRQFHQQMQPVIRLLPRFVRSDNVNISRELRIIANTAKSIYEAIEDKAISRHAAAQHSLELRKSVRRIRRVINRTIVVRQLADGNRAAPAIMPTRNDNPTVESVWPNSRSRSTTAVRFKPRVILHSLTELGDPYDLFMRQIGRELKQIETQENLTPPTVQPSAVKRLRHAPEQGDNSVEIINQRHEQRLDAETLHFQRIMQEVQQELPAPINFGKQDYQMVYYTPVLVIPQKYVPDTLLKSIGFEFIRPLMSLNVGYTPGVYRRTNRPLSTPTLIFARQTLMAVPLKIAMDKSALQELLDLALPALATRLGNLIPVSTGAATQLRTGKSFRFGKTHNPKDLSFGTPEKNIITEPEQAKPTRKKVKLDKKGRPPRDLDLQKIRDAERIAAEQKLRQQQEKKLLKQEQRRAIKLDANRRIYFVNKAYPGVAWIWLLPQEKYNRIANIHFISINLPVAKDLVTTEVGPTKFGPALVRQKTEELTKAEQKSRQLRDINITKEIESIRDQQKIADVYKERVLAQRRSLQNDLESYADLIYREQQKLNQLDKSNPEFARVEARITQIKISAESVVGRIKQLDESAIREVVRIKAELETKIKELAKNAAQQRKSPSNKK